MCKHLFLYAIGLVILNVITSSNATLSFGLFKHRTNTTTTTTTTTEKPTTKASLWQENNIPKIADGCTGNYICKKKVKHGVDKSRVCVKYCLKSVTCPPGVNGVPSVISHDWCVLLNEAMLDDEPTTTQGTIAVMPVNMIDFPCQPGYLPDSRGRCREVW